VNTLGCLISPESCCWSDRPDIGLWLDTALRQGGMSVECATDGLGLAIMKEIACQHGELVWVTSLVNKERRTFFQFRKKAMSKIVDWTLLI